MSATADLRRPTLKKRSHLKTRKLRRRRSTRLPISFAATILVLSATVAVLLYLRSISGLPLVVKHIPQSIPSYGGIIGRYAPSDALQVSYDDLTAIRRLNITAIPNNVILELVEPKLTLTSSEVNSRLTVGLSAPNATVTVALLTPSGFAKASSAFETTTLPFSQVGTSRLFSVSNIAGGSRAATWVTLLGDDRGIAFSEGALVAFDAMNRVLGVRNGSLSSILARLDVQRLFYTVNGTANHLAIGIQNFPGAVTTGQMTLVTVDDASPLLRISNVVDFSSSQQA